MAKTYDPAWGEKPRSVRVNETLWLRASHAAAMQGITLSSVIRDALTEFADAHEAAEKSSDSE